jgi:hypothetical protein
MIPSTRWTSAGLSFIRRRKKPLAASGVVLVVCWWVILRPAPRLREGVIFVGGTTDERRNADIVFVHGLGGDFKTTWQGRDGSFFWPEQIGKRFPNVGIWSVAYDAQPTEWLGRGMPLVDRSKNLLEQLRLNGLGTRPLVFIGHSLGGIVIKQMLRDAFTQNNDDWEEIGNETDGVVFLATPHTGSEAAIMAKLADVYLPGIVRMTPTVGELQSNAAMLRDLNVWYRNNVPGRDIRTSVLYENLPYEKVGTVIVDAASADPGIAGVTPIAVQADHISICKVDEEANLVYRSVSEFISKTLEPAQTLYPISFAEFVKEFSSVRDDPAKLAEFKKEHVKQKVQWNAMLCEVTPDKKRPWCMIGLSASTPVPDQVVAYFRPTSFRDSIQKHDVVWLEGLLAEATSSAGAILRNCQVTNKK